MIVDEVVYFNNSLGDISAVNLKDGSLIWQLPTQGNIIYESAFSLETSDIIADKNNLYLKFHEIESIKVWPKMTMVDVKQGEYDSKSNEMVRETRRFYHFYNVFHRLVS